MQHDDIVRAITAALAFGFMLAGHYLGDQWVQTSGQACKKALDAPGGRATALWHCAKHVLTWTATTTGFFLAAAWWLDLPVRPGWLLAGMAVNAGTHFIADLRTPLRWLAEKVSLGGYIAHAVITRNDGTVEQTGPGTGLFHLDQSFHIAVLAIAALVIAGP